MFIRLFATLSALLASMALMLFAGFLQNWTPKGIDTPGIFPVHWTLNLLVLLAFCIGHSVLARPAIKQKLYGRLNAKLSRSVYNLVAAAQLGLLMYFWTPEPSTLWQLQSPVGVGTTYALFGFAWVLLFAATAAIDPLHMFGLRQVFARRVSEPPFSTRGPYRLVRHPIQTALILAFWSTPHMTVGHAVLAAVLTAYSVLATLGLEERDLRAELGQDYENYKRRVPALLPSPLGRRK
jgi:protein-S-isoprenylcysteine O-methyltransferase Ste14